MSFALIILLTWVWMVVIPVVVFWGPLYPFSLSFSAVSAVDELKENPGLHPFTVILSLADKGDGMGERNG